MPEKVLTPTCIKCELGTLMGHTKTATLQTSLPKGKEEEHEVSYTICNGCLSQHGAVVRFWKNEDGETLAYFQKDREEGVPVNLELMH
ncbi:MAG: hypothetical protein QG580_357 [Patescibacteria group bacterium]|jgi:hypothetical protein|nr:hypothetical protein [Patescibacteria group bacterium]